MVANVLEYLQGIVPDILTRSEMQILPISRLLPYFHMLVSQFSHKRGMSTVINNLMV